VGGDLETRRRKLEVLKRHCDTVGRDYDSLVKSTNVTAILGDKAEVDRVINLRTRQSGGTAYWERTPYTGAPQQVAEQIRELVRLGFDYIIFGIPNALEDGAIARIARELVPLIG
jgi:alkanesulfonate monooxygenase SsuD/methylene tetrahydromethanopterin reductase-like flavin-dependent oxidoreductase (luciferase family)